jgi:hypothetical protein
MGDYGGRQTMINDDAAGQIFRYIKLQNSPSRVFVTRGNRMGFKKPSLY